MSKFEKKYVYVLLNVILNRIISCAEWYPVPDEPMESYPGRVRLRALTGCDRGWCEELLLARWSVALLLQVLFEVFALDLDGAP